MSSPLVATQRIEFNYTVQGYPHKLRHYCQSVTGSDPTGYNIVQKDTPGGAGMSVIVDAYWTLLAPMYQGTVTTFGAAKLQQLVGSLWNDLATYFTTVVPTAVGAGIPASQLTTTLIDTMFHRIRVINLETEVSVGIKVVSPAGSSPYALYWQALTAIPSLGSTVPANWIRSRSDLYVRDFVSATSDLNDKLRRGRHTA